MKSPIAKAFFNLALIQAANFVLPLFAVFFILRIVGPEHFGTLSFAQSCAMVLASIADYGYGVSAMRDIAQARNQGEKMSAIASRVFSTKILLFLVLSLLLISVFMITPQAFHSWWVVGGILLIALGNVLMPLWFFLGVDQSHHISWLNLGAKALFVVALLFFLQEEKDYFLFLWFFGASHIAAALLGLQLMRRRYAIQFWPVSWRAIGQELRIGRPLFLSSLSTSSLLHSPMLVLGFFVQGPLLGFFGIAEKILLALIQIVSTFHLASFPSLVKIHHTTQAAAHTKVFFRRYYLRFLVLFSLILLLVYYNAPLLIRFIAGEPAPQAVYYLKHFAPVAFIVALHLPGAQFLLVQSQDKSHQWIYLSVALLAWCGHIIGARTYGPEGSLYAIWGSQSLLTILLLYFAWLYWRKRYPLN